MKKQNRSPKTSDSAPEVSSSPCDMARFTDYFFGQKTASKKSLKTPHQTKSARNLKQK